MFHTSFCNILRFVAGSRLWRKSVQKQKISFVFRKTGSSLLPYYSMKMLKDQILVVISKEMFLFHNRFSSFCGSYYNVVYFRHTQEILQNDVQDIKYHQKCVPGVSEQPMVHLIIKVHSWYT